MIQQEDELSWKTKGCTRICSFCEEEGEGDILHMSHLGFSPDG